MAEAQPLLGNEYTFRFYWKRAGVHTLIRVFAGKTIRPDGTLGLCGSLCMRNEEWDDFRMTLETMKLVGGFEFIQE